MRIAEIKKGTRSKVHGVRVKRTVETRLNTVNRTPWTLNLEPCDLSTLTWIRKNKWTSSLSIPRKQP